MLQNKSNYVWWTCKWLQELILALILCYELLSFQVWGLKIKHFLWKVTVNVFAKNWAYLGTTFWCDKKNVFTSM